MHSIGQVMLSLREHMITPPFFFFLGGGGGGSMPVTTYLVFVNAITDFYELGYTISVP